MDLTRQSENSIYPESVAADGWLTRSFHINWETTVYIVILLLAIFTRFYNLGARTMSHDESLHTKFSWDLYKNGVFQHTPLMHGPILFHMTALDYFLFGDNDFTARIYPAVLGILMVMFPILFRRWIGRWAALLASIMFLISPLILYYNRYIREDTPSIFFTLIMVYCVLMYLNGPPNLRRKARWLYVFSAAMLCSMATKEVAFMYIIIFFAILFLYWLVRVGQLYFRLPGKSIFYFLTITILLGGIAALAFYVIVSVVPLSPAPQQGTTDFASLIKWSLAAIFTMLAIVLGTMLWVSRRGKGRSPWIDVLPMLALIVVVTSVLLIFEEASKIPKDAAVPPYSSLPLYAEWALAIVAIGVLIYLWRSGIWAKLRRFPEVDLMVIMVTLVLPWATPFIMKAMHPKDVTSLVEVANAVQAAIPFQFDLTQTGAQIAAVSLTVWPAIFVSITIGLIWNPKRWLICVAVFHALFLFFFTTVFTNLYGIGTGMFGSLGYWLQQQSERRGSQPQYYYLALIMPFYEFLPVIGSILAMLSGMAIFWRFRQARIATREQKRIEASLAYSGDELPNLNFVTSSEGESSLPVEPLPVLRRRGNADPEEWLGRMPVLIFISWWAIFIMIAFTLAGEKMPWLGTHLTTPMIFIAAWYFGRFFERIDVEAFFKRNWMYLLLLPLLFVAAAQLVAPFIFGGVGGLEQTQLTKMFQWIAGIVVGGGVLYAIYRIVMQTGFTQLRVMGGAVVFAFLAFLTFRSAWMAAFINYDLATEFLVYAHGAPANKAVEQQIEDLSKRITGGLDLKFGYDFKISWPGAWYFRNFPTGAAKFLGENPSPRDMQDLMVVIVGDENKSKAVDALSDNYYEFDYPRMWWPMQDYFNMTADRVINTFDFTNPNSAAIRQGMWDIWWRRDYTTYGQALQKDFTLTKWPVADRMYVFVRKDIAAQVWNLGVGEGTAVAANVSQPNQCTANWQPLQANQTYQVSDQNALPMNHPRQIAVNKDGQIYAAEEFNHRISIFNPDGTFVKSFGQIGQLYVEGDPYFNKISGADSGGVFNRPSGIAIGPSGNIYVSDTWNYRIQVFTPDGKFLNSWGQRGEFGDKAQAEPVDGFWGPRGIAVDGQENVYVADTGNKRIRVYTSTGQYVRDIGAAGSAVGQLDEPSGVTISPDGLLYVADYWNKRISVFTLDGAPVTTFKDAGGLPINSFKVRGWQEDQGNRPYLALDTARKLIYITDPDAGRVLVYGTDGNCVGSFGELNRETTGLNPGQLNSVGGVTLDSAGNVYVADAGAGRILRFAPFAAPAVVQPVNQQPPVVILPNDGQGAESTVEVGAPVESTIEITPEVTAAG
jgi:predicted membrane-bound mannosyltransferase/sugar lactone lactonase YvrE/Na+-transporting methylmalonyl-CoA/oxaloacetate decarboxylase gamma subunit